MALFRIPISTVRGTYFTYKGVQINLSALRYNPYMGEDAWIVDMSWEEGDELLQVSGIVLTAGIDLLKQYKTPLPSLLVLNKEVAGTDPTTIDTIALYIKEA